MSTPLSDALRNACAEIRRKPFPIAELIPLLQKVADEIDKIDAARAAGTLVNTADAIEGVSDGHGTIHQRESLRMFNNGDRVLILRAPAAEGRE